MNELQAAEVVLMEQAKDFGVLPSELTWGWRFGVQGSLGTHVEFVVHYVGVGTLQLG